MMQAAVRVFADKGYQSATIRDIVDAAGVAVGTFYFYFPDKETLFVYLYDETADFLLQAIQQALRGRATLPKQFSTAIQAFFNIGVFDPAIIHLILIGGVGAVPALVEKQAKYRESLVQIWQQPLDHALEKGLIPEQNTRRSAEALAGAIDEVILNLLDHPDPSEELPAAIDDLTQFALRAVSFRG
jgi:AcrR family transcriptional regulator